MATTKEKKYIEGIGGRKSATARVRITPGEKGIKINDVDYKKYFPLVRQQIAVTAPLKLTETSDEFGISVHVKGSGLSGQAGAVRHGIARALVKWNEELRKKLKKEGFLTRDSRMVERKKYGLRKARRRPQWSKR
ncbi:MAG: 30S ribosomal protein S9 [Candidatus Harrisonbacteria bacterium CG10_big_fil_rev_8_21_14_0_10_44_23]|uniref:Small ribosomal subunit protein uS9 n=1 Tax=Candidatus Harrisonbacteria bacterium CG10_big_fil_rev_8_21_14_0_10_44_23 TaxID=1974585 RepID=A0A2H0UQ98_9BACT|nr:MAG: 30S ribosomal protein S9 [Candidatus Harrisonbacteria bacterium CG10_big_fil_rev_8_21_14_0_10_44_23]